MMFLYIYIYILLIYLLDGWQQTWAHFLRLLNLVGSRIKSNYLTFDGIFQKSFYIEKRFEIFKLHLNSLNNLV